MKNLNDFYKLSATNFKDEILFDHEITYKEAYNLAKQRGAFLIKGGLKKGDVVAISAGSSKEWAMTYMAITMMGFIALPLDNNLPGKEQIKMMKRLGTKALFTDSKSKFKIPGIKILDISFDGNITNAKGIRIPNTDTEYPASYVFTSGTTGSPKIITLTHGNLFKTAISCSDWLGLTKEDNFISILPLFHVYAFIANFAGPYYKGSSFVFLQSLKGADIIKTLKENEFTVFPAAPQLWEMFMETILKKAKAQSRAKYGVLKFFLNTEPFFRTVGLSAIPRAVFKPIREIFGESMKYFISGGAPLKHRYFKYYSRMGLPILEGYGLTETTGPITISHFDKNKMGSVGPAMTGNEIKIKNINEDGIGEIWLRGISVMKEYYDNPKATDEAFDEESFFNTGDLGRVDSDGYLYIKGRSKNVIILDSGKSVYPEELESFYKNSPEISEISVFGRKIKGKESVYAVIVPEKKSSKSYEIIQSEINKLSKDLPSYKTITAFAISLDSLPVNSTRKILVREVIKNLDAGLYMTTPQGKIKNISPLEGNDAREKKAIGILKKELNEKKLYANDHLADYGVDSIKLIEIISALEEALNINIDITSFNDAGTFQELITYITTLENSSLEKEEKDILSSPITTQNVGFFNPLNEFLIFIFKIIAKRFWNISLENKENIVVDNTIIVANHQSNLDYLLALSLLPFKKRKDLYVIGKKELWFLRYIFWGTNVLFVEREGNIMPALKASADILRQGKSLFIFPEGTRSKDKKLLPFKTGAAYLAHNLNKKIVPLGLKGTGDILPKGKAMPKFSHVAPITIKTGAEINPEKYKTVESLNKKLYSTINSLTKEKKEKE